MNDEIKSREDLYSAVWSKSMMKLAEEFGISGRGLAKLCERLKVPVPSRGYWRKFSLGQTIEKTPLPEVEFTRYELWKNKSSLDELERRRKAEKERTELFNNPEIEVKDKSLQEMFLQIVQAEQQSMPITIDSGQEIVSPQVKNFLDIHSRNKRVLPFYQHSGNLAIEVSDTCALRAGLLMETLLQGFRERNWNFTIEQEDDSHKARMFVYLFGQKIYFRIHELVVSKVVPLTENEREVYRKSHRYGRVPKNNYIPTATGRLVLEIHNGNLVRQSWEDRSKHLIEASIKDMMLGFIYVGIKSSNEAILAREREQRLKLEQARKLEEDRLKKLETKRYDRLIAGSEAYRLMQIFQNYVEYVKNQAQNQAAEPESEISKWLEWAQTKIDDLNPLKNGLPKFTVEEHPENKNNPSASFLDDLFRNYRVLNGCGRKLICSLEIPQLTGHIEKSSTVLFDCRQVVAGAYP